jgi:hypothetical protein
MFALFVQIENIAKQLFQRLFIERNNSDICEQELISDQSESEIDKNITENLQKSIQNLIQLKQIKCTKFSIDKDFRSLGGNCGRSDNMDILYKALSTISPTSTSCERVFSVTGNTITKIRSRLNTKR